MKADQGKDDQLWPWESLKTREWGLHTNKREYPEHAKGTMNPTIMHATRFHTRGVARIV